MDKRTLLIIAALALPPIALAILVQTDIASSKKVSSPVTRAPDPLPAPATPVTKGAMSTEPVRLPPLEITPRKNGSAAAKQLDRTRQRILKRLKRLKSMTPQQWEKERMRNPRVPPSLQEAIANNERILSELQMITPEQWATGVRPTPRKQ